MEKDLIYKIMYSLILVYISFSIIDSYVTYEGIEKGGVEGNPFFADFTGQGFIVFLVGVIVSESLFLGLIFIGSWIASYRIRGLFPLIFSFMLSIGIVRHIWGISTWMNFLL